MTECERAKQWLSENWEGDFWDEDVRSLMQFMREERARTWEEARGLLLAQQCHEPFYGSAIYKQVVVDFARWIDRLVDMCEERAKALREEGGQT